MILMKVGASKDVLVLNMVIILCTQCTTHIRPVYGASKDVLVPENEVRGVAGGGRGQVTWDSHLNDVDVDKRC